MAGAGTGAIDHSLDLPQRRPKPRRSGLTMVIDPGTPTRHFEDAVDSTGSLVDLVKFGWGTAVVTRDLDRKIACLRRSGIDYFFGGTLFEKFVQQDRFDRYVAFCHAHGCRHVEVSNGTIALSNREKARYIGRLRRDFEVLSEVGFKESARSMMLPAAAWVEYIEEDLEAGASLVVTEARESGRSGICRPDGQVRDDLIDTILQSGLDVDRVLFEAPTKELQAYFVRRVGPDVNLGNITLGDVIGQETLRLGLRSDTLLSSVELRSRA